MAYYPFSRYYSGYHLGGISFSCICSYSYSVLEEKSQKNAFQCVPQVNTPQEVIISLKHEHFTR